jgi:hypothetical protein
MMAVHAVRDRRWQSPGPDRAHRGEEPLPPQGRAAPAGVGDEIVDGHAALRAVLRPVAWVPPASRPEADPKAEDEHDEDADTEEHPDHSLPRQLLPDLEYQDISLDLASPPLTCVEMSSKSSFMRWKETIMALDRPAQVKVIAAGNRAMGIT